VNSDEPAAVRKQEANLRTLVKAMRNGNFRNVTMKGSRINNHSTNNSGRPGNPRRSGNGRSNNLSDHEADVAVHVVVITQMNVLVVFLAGEAIIVTIHVEVTIVQTTHINPNIIVEIKHKLTVILLQKGINRICPIIKMLIQTKRHTIVIIQVKIGGVEEETTDCQQVFGT
jgi:hypothetical protein